MNKTITILYFIAILSFSAFENTAKNLNTKITTTSTETACKRSIQFEKDELQIQGPFKPTGERKNENFAMKRTKGIVAKIAKMKSFDKWKIFEDAEIKFIYPDHKAISVDVKYNDLKPLDKKHANIDKNFTREYHITADGKTLLLITLQKADWLDDEVCFCGPIVYMHYLEHNGNLYRFSFLEDGNLKKMQILGGNDERIMLSEWTHSFIHPEVYRHIAKSLEFKKSASWSKDYCIKQVKEHYGESAVFGFFNKGTSVNSVEKIFGKPDKIKNDGRYIWEYTKTENGYQWTEQLTLTFKNGKLQEFGSDYYTVSEEKAIKGSIPWMVETAESYENDDKTRKMPENLKKELLALFLEKAQDKKNDFDSLCQVLWTLLKQGVKDEEALKIVRKHFKSKGGHHAAWVLHEAGHPEDIDLFVDKIKQLYSKGKANPEAPAEDDFDEFSNFFDLDNWLCFIPKGDKRYANLLREGLQSPNANIRETAYYFLNSAPFSSEECRNFAHIGLQDSSNRVRYWSIGFYKEKDLTQKDLELLRKLAKQEKDKSNIKKLKEILKKHKINQNSK